MEYITEPGDTWDKIAHKVYGDSYAAHLLMQANGQHIETVIFDGGCRLLVPERQETRDGFLPPWRYEAVYE